MNVSHSPQDELYGPLNIPSYCWQIIDTIEYQRLRHISQLGVCQYVFPGATHTRFEHCLGVAHLANTFMTHIKNSQPELDIKDEYCQAVIIAGLCHDLGHGPWSHCFEKIAHMYNSDWDHEEMSCRILKHIIEKYKINISSTVIDAACNFILGLEYPGYPAWLSQIIANKVIDIDLDKFDYLARDINRTLSISRFQYDRLIIHCRIVDNQLAWRQSEMNTIERLFYNRNDMHKRVYLHRVVQAISSMVTDMLLFASENSLNIDLAIDDVDEFIRLDDRIFSLILNGEYGDEAQQLARDILERKLYKCIGELHLKPENKEGLSYSQLPENTFESDIASYCDMPPTLLRVIKMSFRYGLSKEKHPLLKIPFWKPNLEHVYHLTEDDISCIVPIHFMETAMRVFVTEAEYLEKARRAFNLWKEQKCFQ